MKRPSVITIISVVLIVLGFFMLLTEVFMLILSTSSNNFVLIMPAVLAAATIVSGIGLLLGKRWGWRIAAVFTAIMAGGCLNTIISYFLSDSVSYANGMINGLPIIVIIIVSLILALFNPKSTEYFGFSNEERRKTVIILCIAIAALTLFGSVRGLMVK